MVVDANVGFNKVNPLINETISYQVKLNPNGTGRAIAMLDYVHIGTGPEIPCSQIISYHSNVAYSNMMEACYYDYLRLIVPPGSRLLQATTHKVPGSYLVTGRESDENTKTLMDTPSNWTTFGQFFVVEYGKQLQTRLEYDLPIVVSDVSRKKRYTLLVQKQSGTDAMRVSVKITLPTQSRLVSSNILPVFQSGDILEFIIDLSADQQLEIIYSPAP
jgi:hypothetical protein